jgi:hypothetical protein
MSVKTFAPAGQYLESYLMLAKRFGFAPTEQLNSLFALLLLILGSSGA